MTRSRWGLSIDTAEPSILINYQCMYCPHFSFTTKSNRYNTPLNYVMYYFYRDCVPNFGTHSSGGK